MTNIKELKAVFKYNYFIMLKISDWSQSLEVWNNTEYSRARIATYKFIFSLLARFWLICQMLVNENSLFPNILTAQLFHLSILKHWRNQKILQQSFRIQ